MQPFSIVSEEESWPHFRSFALLKNAGWQFNWLKFSLEKPLEFWLEFWLEFPLDSTEEKGPF